MTAPPSDASGRLWKGAGALATAVFAALLAAGGAWFGASHQGHIANTNAQLEFLRGQRIAVYTKFVTDANTQVQTLKELANPVRLLPESKKPVAQVFIVPSGPGSPTSARSTPASSPSPGTKISPADISGVQAVARAQMSTIQLDADQLFLLAGPDVVRTAADLKHQLFYATYYLANDFRTNRLPGEVSADDFLNYSYCTVLFRNYVEDVDNLTAYARQDMGDGRPFGLGPTPAEPTPPRPSQTPETTGASPGSLANPQAPLPC